MATELMAVRSVKLPKVLLDELLQMAEREQRTVSAMMRILLEQAVKARKNMATPHWPPAKVNRYKQIRG